MCICFSAKTSVFYSDASKVQFIFGLLRGKALAWAEARFSRRPVRATSYAEFLKEFKRVFNHPDYKSSASLKLTSLSQSSHISNYSVEFWTVAAKMDWTEDTLRAAYSKGISERIKDELVSRDDPLDLDSLISLYIRLDKRLRSHRYEQTL